VVLKEVRGVIYPLRDVFLGATGFYQVNTNERGQSFLRVGMTMPN